VRQSAQHQADAARYSYDDEEQNQRQRDALPPVLDESLHAPALDEHAREEPGDHEKRRHAEHVNDEVDDRRAAARRVEPQRHREAH
jgi:hypothetical protein